jgi:hypothetical protein
METTENNFGTATSRQRWALYCITKKDYRTTKLSKEEAANLIKELGDPDHKSKKTIKTKKVSHKPTLRDEFVEYFKGNIDKVMDNAKRGTLGYESGVVVSGNGEKHVHGFLGAGLGISYLKPKRNTKRAQDLVDIIDDVRRSEAEDIFLSQFSGADIVRYKNFGTPLEAVWMQDLNINSHYYQLAADFAATKGLQMRVVSYLD